MFSSKTVQRGQLNEEGGYRANGPAKEDSKEIISNESLPLLFDPPNINNTRGSEPVDTENPSLISYYAYISLTLLALICPWLFFGLVKHQGGVQFSHRTSRWVIDNPKSNDFVFTTTSSILVYIIGFLSGNAMSNFAQMWIARRGTSIFGLSLFIGFKKRVFPWQFKWSSEFLRRLMTQHIFWVLALVIYMIMFQSLLISGISTLIKPGTFTRHANVQGQELDFGASGPECATWFSENMISNTCDWGIYNGGRFSTCTENQLADVLESGRNNILSSRPNSSIGVKMTQFGLQLLGPMRGVLPNGPNGIPQFNTIPDSPFNASSVTDLTYNYTLELQGLASKVSCAYTTDSPIKYGSISSQNITWWTYNGTCDSGQDFLGIPYFMVPPLLSRANNGLGFWACGTGQSYIVYLRGVYGYNQSIGDIACTISPIQPAIFPVEYIEKTGYFATKEPTSFSPGTSSELVSRAIMSLGSVIQETQGMVFNEFVETVLYLGIKSFGVQPGHQSNTSLQLFEAMIQGIIEYEATSIRLLYTASSTPPPMSCLRTIDGFVDYQVIGWFVNTNNAYYLIPLTIVNVISLFMFVVKNSRPFGFDPTVQNLFIFDTDQYVEIDQTEPENWGKEIEHGQTAEGKKGLRMKEKGQGTE